MGGRGGRVREGRQRRGDGGVTAAVAPEAEAAAAGGAGGDGGEGRPVVDVRLVAVVGTGERSPMGEVTWREVMEHMANRLDWIEPGVKLSVFEDSVLLSPEGEGRAAAVALAEALRTADILVAVGVRDPGAGKRLAEMGGRVDTFVAFDSGEELREKVRLRGTEIGTLVEGSASLPLRAAAALPWSSQRAALLDFEAVNNAWQRARADNVLYVLMILADRCVAPLPTLKNLRAGDINSVRCMIDNCQQQVVNCFTNSTCREALQCLGKCDPTDQVCSYRCIVSYECPEFEAFALCILQKHNCLGMTAEVRMTPEVLPMTTFRGSPLTFEAAEQIYIGWLRGAGSVALVGSGDPPAGDCAEPEGLQSYSWRVVAGQNAAYDQFPCQYQLYYRGRGKAFWYDPVFKVKKFDGTTVWRRRHYRVVRADVAGTFWYSVLDNGVTSREFWRIVDCPDDMSWALFYYSGAAAAAGQAYTGAVLCSKDGKWPAGEDQQERVLAALDRCGIKVWELFKVDNNSCAGAPLDMEHASQGT